MEAEVTYIAKDGRRFTDALQCEEYEKTIGIVPGSVADFIRNLRELPSENYISGSIMVQTNIDTGTSFQNFVSSSMDEDDDESDPLFSEKSITTTVSEAIERLSKLYKPDAPCQYICLVADKVSTQKGIILANINKQIFENARRQSK